MADTTTTTYAFIKPEVGGASDTWGTSLNTDWDKVDQLLSGVSPLLAGIKINSNANATVTLNDTDATLGAALTGRLNFQASGTSAGYVGFNGSTALSMQNLTGSLFFDTDPNNLYAGTNVSFAVDGVAAARVEAAGVGAANDFSIITREKGDARYAQLAAANTFTLNPTIANSASSLTLNDTDATLGGATTDRIIMQSSGAQAGLLGFNGSTVLYVQNSVGIVTVDVDPNNTVANSNFSVLIDGVTAARTEPAGTTMPNTTTAATREKGDARWTAISDARMKENITPMAPALALVNQLTAVNYNWIAPSVARPEGPRLGIIAQDVQSAFPDAIIEWEDGTLGVDTLALIGVLIKSVQELTGRVAALENA